MQFFIEDPPPFVALNRINLNDGAGTIRNSPFQRRSPRVVLLTAPNHAASHSREPPARARGLRMRRRLFSQHEKRRLKCVVGVRRRKRTATNRPNQWPMPLHDLGK